MTKMEKAQICDNILRRFQGNGSVAWENLRTELAHDMHQYYVTENNINFLIADDMLRRDLTGGLLNLTEKGFATLAELDTLGYVAREKEQQEAESQSLQKLRTDRGIQIAILIISEIALVISLIALLK